MKSSLALLLGFSIALMLPACLPSGPSIEMPEMKADASAIEVDGGGRVGLDAGAVDAGADDLCPADALKTAPGVCGCGISEVDADTDGVPDCVDGCPLDTSKRAPGQCGCGAAETDADGDGTANCNDACPSDALKVMPGVCGCATSDVDSDSDSTPNCLDGCPFASFKTQPGSCGCAEPDDDDDGDGTLNCLDGCPGDPAKLMPGICGCGQNELDTDNDGTFNCKDACPNDPAKTKAGSCGCGIADTDSDSDGFPNCTDSCPNDPLKRTAGACGCGVADTNSDSDAVPDCNDACPLNGMKTAAGVCGCSAADVDGDGDGKLDCQDGCPSDALKSDAGICGCGNPEFAEYSVAQTQTIFVTSSALGASFGGLANADAFCQRHAADAGLGTNFVAVLSAPGTAAKDRVHLCGGAKSTLGSTTFSRQSEMFPASAAAASIKVLNLDERGRAVDLVTPTIRVWTGSTLTGAVDANTCSGWSSTSGSGANGQVADVFPGAWLSAGFLSCAQTARLYCVSQPPPVVVSTAISPGSALIDRSKASTTRFALLQTMSYGQPTDVSASATWDTSNPGVATVSDAVGSKGLVTGVAAGTATITAQFSGTTFSATVRVVDTAHWVFMTSTTASITSVSSPHGVSDANNAWYDWANDVCATRASRGGLLGTFVALNFAGRAFTVLAGSNGASNLLPVTFSAGPVMTQAGTTIFADAADLTTSNPLTRIGIDEFGAAFSGSAWTSSCIFDFLLSKNVGTYSNGTAFDNGRAACSEQRRLICISQ